MSLDDVDIDAIKVIQKRAASSSYMEAGPQLVIDYASTLWSPPGARPRDPSSIFDQRIELGTRAVYVINALAKTGELEKYLPSRTSVSATTIAELAATENLGWVDFDEALSKAFDRYVDAPCGVDRLKALCGIVALVADATRDRPRVEGVEVGSMPLRATLVTDDGHAKY